MSTRDLERLIGHTVTKTWLFVLWRGRLFGRATDGSWFEYSTEGR